MIKLIPLVLVICAMEHVKAHCYNTTTHKAYVGRYDKTETGRTCQRWSSQSPHTHTRNDPTSFPDATLADASNYCRDPDNEGFLWCYTTDANKRFETCGISRCSGSVHCYNSATHQAYVGNYDKTETGRTCQRWSSQSPHRHFNNDPTSFPDATLADAGNFCRDPDNDGYLWCYTTASTRWETCGMSRCLGSASVRMLIKHKSSGKFWHPEGGSDRPRDNTDVVVHSGWNAEYVQFEFVHYEEQWGYIRHYTSGKYIHPYGGHLYPEDNTDLLFHSGYSAAQLFALDANRDVIIHKGGRYVHPDGGSAAPADTTNVLLHGGGIHDGMKWQFVDPNDPTIEVLPYGKPRMTGSWKITNSVLTPIASHVYTVRVKIGKSNTESTTSSFKYTWEVNAGVSLDKFDIGGSQTIELMYGRTTSQTWSEETEETKTITIIPGRSVVTWQYVFESNQNDHRAVYRSNIRADTNSTAKVPDNNTPITV